MIRLAWESVPGGVHRVQINGNTVAGIVRNDPDAYALIVVKSRYGRETRAEVIGDDLEQNKQTARDMLRAVGWNV